MVVFNMMFLVVFIVVIIFFIVAIIQNVHTWNTNNHSPCLTVVARVVSKRTDLSFHQHPNAGDATGAHGYHSMMHTRYYVTFEAESRDRMEFSVSGSEYGILIENDQGRLTFQGTRYLSFDRE